MSHACSALPLSPPVLSSTATTMTSTTGSSVLGKALFVLEQMDAVANAAATVGRQHDDVAGRSFPNEVSETTTFCQVAMTLSTSFSSSSCLATDIDQDMTGLPQLPEDLIFRVTGFLDVPSLVTLRCVSRQFRQIASRNEAGWEALCQQLWRDKIHVAENALSCRSRLLAYQLSRQDAATRHCIKRNELLFDPEEETGTIWSFRFKESAGTEWTSVDPWFHGRPCRKMVFLKDGTAKQYIHPSQMPPTGMTDGLFDYTSAGANTTVAAAVSRQQQRLAFHSNTNNGNSHFVDIETVMAVEVENLADETVRSDVTRSSTTPYIAARRLRSGAIMVNPPTPILWRFSTRPMDLPSRPLGSYLRFSVGGRDVPTYAVRRSPTGNWGFLLESCWGLYASFELPPRPRPAASLLQQRFHRRRRRLRREGQGGPLWIEAALSSSSEEDDDDHDDTAGGADGTVRRRRGRGNGARNTSTHDTLSASSCAAALSLLQDDSELPITSEIQWREAFLYNVGARVLPEGDHATDDFDRAWETM